MISQSLKALHNIKLPHQSYQSAGVLAFLVFMKLSGIRNIENNKLFLHFLAPIAKLSWM